MIDLCAPEWCASYLRIPFREKGRDRTGVDCWGLVRLALEEQFGFLGLPGYEDGYRDTADRDGIAEAVRSGLLQGWEPADSPAAGSLVILRLAGRPWHCGLMANRTWMLHTLEGTGVCVERVDGLLWRNRIEGWWRYAG